MGNIWVFWIFLFISFNCRSAFGVCLGSVVCVFMILAGICGSTEVRFCWFEILCIQLNLCYEKCQKIKSLSIMFFVLPQYLNFFFFLFAFLRSCGFMFFNIIYSCVFMFLNFLKIDKLIFKNQMLIRYFLNIILIEMIYQ